MNERPSLLFLLAVALLAAASLAFEVLLMRLFSILQWHHFAYMIISLALLGYGASGTLMAFLGEGLLHRFERAWSLLAVGFALSMPLVFLLAEQVPFNPLELLWDPWQWLWLAVVYLLLMLPFLLVALLIGISFARYGKRIGAIYGADLLGAGVGALAVVALLYWGFPRQLLLLLTVVALAGASLGAWVMKRSRLALASVLLALLLVGTVRQGVPLSPNPFKTLQQQLQVMGTRVLGEYSSPLAKLTVVESQQVPLRYVPGLSLNAPQSPPDQLGLFVDGDAMMAITRVAGDPGSLAFLAWTPEAAAWELLPDRPRVLALGAGTGMPVLRALHLGAREVHAVEVNGQVVALMRGPFAAYSGDLYDRPGVHVVTAEARHHVRNSNMLFDLVELPLLDAFNAASAGLYAVSESYVYTVEALREYLQRLAPGGLLSVTRWVRLPPREGVKLFAMAVEALEKEGIADPGRHLIWIRGWNTATLLVRTTPFSQAEVERLARFARSRSFDLAWAPGLAREEVNRFNRLPRPWFYDAARSILGKERRSFYRDYRFHVEPATDDRPYFYRFFRWNLLPEMVRMRRQGSTFLQETGYLVLVITLAQALLLAGLLLILPLRLQRGGRAPGWRQHGYFFFVGLGFMFIEIIAIQLFIRYLAHPVYAVAVVLSAFLVFAGLGAWVSLKVKSGRRRRVTGLAVLVAGLLAVSYPALLDLLVATTHGGSDALRILVSLFFIAPLAFAMGFPFTLGLSEVAGAGRLYVPWAWAVNGFASVLGTTLATLAAVHLGLQRVLLLAALFYLLAWCCWPVVSAKRARDG